MSRLIVDYTLCRSLYIMINLLETLDKKQPNILVAFDIETAGVYSKEQRKEAQKLLDEGNLDEYTRRLAAVAANNNGLSFPSIIKTTHFVFGWNKDNSTIYVPNNEREEAAFWNFLTHIKLKMIIHNSLFDLKVMYHRTGKLFKDFEDSALRAKTLINDANSWKAKTGLKELMGSYYDPKWSLFEDYEPEDPCNKKFLEYAAIDGAATIHLWEILNSWRFQTNGK